jgi:hypothetical protein
MASADYPWPRRNNWRLAPNNPGSGLSITLVPAVDLFDVEQRVMYELLFKMEPGQLIGLVAVVGGLVCGLVAIVMGVGLEIRRVELAAALKKDMLERGMTAEEIRIIMEAGSKNSERLCKSRVDAEV